MIQDIYPHQFHNQFRANLTPTPNDFALVISNGTILVSKNDYDNYQIHFPMIRELDMPLSAFIYAFSIDDTKFFLLLEPLQNKPSNYQFIEERLFRAVGYGPDDALFAATTAKHLGDWYRDTAYCGRCGHKMIHSTTERAMVCKECHYTAYPRIMPAVIVGVVHQDQLLLTKYKTGFAYNALIAGFTEIGETVEETVAREVMEEVGLKVKNITYYKSQPWGSANDILLGFYCEVDGDTTITMDENELKYAQWVQREEIELQPGSFSLTNEMMKRFKESES